MSDVGIKIKSITELQLASNQFEKQSAFQIKR